MTHSDYEIASVKAAGAELRYRGEAKLSAVDRRIAEVESTLVFLLHERREIVNQYDLNKKPELSLVHGTEVINNVVNTCAHEPFRGNDGGCYCYHCGVELK